MAKNDFSQLIGQTVGAKIRTARQSQKMTQSALARPDFSVSYISAIERGQIHPSLRALEILAKRLGLPSTELLPKSDTADSQDSSPQPVPIGRKEDIIDLTLLEAQILLLQEAPLQAIHLLEELPLKNLKRPQQAHCAYLLGWAYFKLGRLQDSEIILSDAIQPAKHLNETPFIPSIFCLLGRVSASLNHLTQAHYYYQQCLTYLEERKIVAPFFKGQVYLHLGEYYVYAQNIPAAIDLFQQAIALLDIGSKNEARSSLYWKLCQSYAQEKEFPLAALNAVKCSLLIHQQTTSSRRSQLIHYLGQALLKHDKEQARTYLEQALQQEDLDELTRASLTTHLAELYLQQDALKDAEAHAALARRLVNSFGKTAVAALAFITSGRIAYRRSDYKQGDQYFVAGLNILEELGLKEDLAEQAARYAQLLETHGKMTEALAYFKSAYEHRMSIPLYARL